jgi:spoIIIJ-associated protein
VELSEGELPSERVRGVMERVADAAGISASVAIDEDDEEIRAEFSGEDAEQLIGHRGETIDAIQHLAYRIAFQGEPARKGVVVDASGYRERRAVALRAAADQAADAVVRDGRAVPLEPMSAIERKLVHEHLRTRRDVETYSEGEEPERRLVVAPVV